MKKTIASLPIAAILLIGCGGDNPSTQTNNNQDTQIVENATITIPAKNNTLKEIVKPFGSYQVKVLTDISLDEDAVSNDTIALYGEINKESTKALLKLNSNYPAGTKIIVQVFDSSPKLVGESKEHVYNGDGKPINFGLIDVQ